MQAQDRKARRCQREGERRLERHRREKKLSSFAELTEALSKQTPVQQRGNANAGRKQSE
jgi:hypothetical protein